MSGMQDGRKTETYQGDAKLAGLLKEQRSFTDLDGLKAMIAGVAAAPAGDRADDWISLAPGVYHVLYNEVVSLPEGLMALGRARSSLGRSGVTIHTAVWDAGYSGRSTSLLSVLNPAGFRVQRNARVMQLVFFGLATATAEGYAGQYQDENVE